MAEEAIDSTLNDGTDIDGWFAAHKDQIHPSNQSIMPNDLKAGQYAVAREPWMATKPGLSYVHGATTPRVTTRSITPTKLYFVGSSTLQGVALDTTVSYEMAVLYGEDGNKAQSTKATVTYSAAKDPADGKWKIAGYSTKFDTTPEFALK